MACGQPPAARTSAPKPTPPELFEGDLSEYVASAGLRWLVLGKPEELAHEPEVVRSLSRLLPDDKLDAFARSTGVDIRRVPHALAAGFDYATLYMAEVPGSHSAIIERFTERLHEPPRVRRPHPRLTWISGTRAGLPETLLSYDGHWIAVSLGDPTPARVAEAFARRRLKKSPSALRGSALSQLPGDLVTAPVCFLAPGPFTDQWASGLHGLLHDALAVGVTARPAEGEHVQLRAVVAGDFASRGASSLLITGWDDLAKSDLGRLLRLDEPAAPARTVVHARDIELDVELELHPIADGLHAAVAADVWTLLGTKPADGAPFERPGRPQASPKSPLEDGGL